MRTPVLTAVAAGGALGAAARHGLGLLVPGPALATLVVNLSGCLLIGVLAVVVDELRAGHRLLRPLLGTGVLGGYTTFSGYALDVQRFVLDGRYLAAAVYLAGTVAGALLAVSAGGALARRLVPLARRRRPM